ncbi:MAG TPA: hypothetical protein VFQ25_04915 [Ktedonobacterales bacterium]|nr:hypothetical protein [Ktedonobacterales bacterium]
MSEHAARRYRDRPGLQRVGWTWLAPALALIPLMALTLAGCGTQAGDWRLLSPASAHMYNVLTDPHIATLVYAGADDGSVYRARADQPGLAVPGAGLPKDTVVASLLADQKIAGRLLAGTTAGLYRSDHYGDTWSAFGKGLPAGATVLALDSTPDDSLVLAGLDQRGVYRSTDNGATWTLASNGLPATATVTALAWDSAHQRWWAGLQGASGHSLFSSADGGQAWSPSDSGMPARADVNALASVTGADGGITRYAATSAGLYFGSGDGQAWSKVTGTLPSGAALAVIPVSGQPGAVVVSIGSGVYYSANGASGWSPVAQGLTQPAQGLAVATDGHGAPVYYAAAGQLARYPSGARSSDSTLFLLIITALGALLVGGYVLWRRSRRFGAAMGARATAQTMGRAAEAARAWERQRAGLTGRPRAPDAARRSVEGAAPSPALSPTDLTTKERTGEPAPPDKAAQNGHGDPTLHQ